MDTKEITMIKELLEAIKTDSTDKADTLLRRILKHKISSKDTTGE